MAHKMAHKNVTEEARTFGALLRLPYQKLQQQVYTQLAANGFEDIRPAHSNVFRYILPAGSRVTELAERAEMTKQSMAYLVNYLEEHGYVTQMADPLDGRAKLVQLTPRGVAVQQTALEFSQQVEDQLARHIGKQHMKQLRSLLELVVDNLDRLE
ncbi:MAG: winged helix DNA-binding protein [Abitibacteriaceae bacterium]|nr:winged helix DNA-binding protein [Abditibacteriaceae bacterium]